MSLSRPLCTLALLHAAVADRTTDLYRLEIGEATEPSQSAASSSLISRAIREMVLDEPLMCGDNEIRRTLQVDTHDQFDVERVKNIRFDAAFDSANRYIEKKKEEEERLASELKDLESQWYQVSTESNTGKPTVPEDQVKSVIKGAFEAGFTTVEEAVAIDCSELPEHAPNGVDPYEATKDHFEKSLGEAMGVGQFSELVRGRVKELCITVLGLKDDPATGTCDTLCDALGAKAESVSDTAVVKSAAAGELMERIQHKRSEIETTKATIKDCETTREGIRTYSTQIKGIVAEHDSHGKSQREIKRRLAEVMDSLTMYSQAVNSETELLDQLLALLKTTKAEDAEVQQQIQDNSAETARLKAAQAEVKANLADLQQHLTLTQHAVKAIQAFKAGLVMTMQTFVQIYDDAIRRPLRDAGITKVIEAAGDDIFPEVDSAAATVWAQPSDRVRDLETQCKEVAEKSRGFCDLASVASNDTSIQSEKQDLSMCNMGRDLENTCGSQLQPKDYVDSVREAVVAKQTDVKRWIAGLKQEIENLVDRQTLPKENGEPEWLRRFASVLPNTKFYQDFVTKWSASQGSHEEEWSGSEDKTAKGVILSMLKVMGAVEVQVKSKVLYTTSKLKDLADQYVLAVKRDAELRAKLAALETELSDEDAKKIALSTKLEEYEKDLAEKEGQRKRLQVQLDALTVNFRDLEGNMQTVFHEFEGGASVNFKGLPGGDSLATLSKVPAAKEAPAAKAAPATKDVPTTKALRDTSPHRG